MASRESISRPGMGFLRLSTTLFSELLSISWPISRTSLERREKQRRHRSFRALFSPFRKNCDLSVNLNLRFVIGKRCPDFIVPHRKFLFNLMSRQEGERHGRNYDSTGHPAGGPALCR